MAAAMRTRIDNLARRGTRGQRHAAWAVACAALAGLSIAGCEPPAGSAPSAPSAARDTAAEHDVETITNSIGMKLVRIPQGEFLMGSSRDDPGWREDETPRHKVRITRPFHLGMYEVTQAEFEEVMGTNPSAFSKTAMLADAPDDLDCSRFPVDGLTWYEAVEFCRRLSDRSDEKAAGRVYRLPTEAEWEYAARAGTTTVFAFGDALSSTEANFNGNYPFGDAAKGPFLNRTTTVGSYRPNAFGLYDMHGNLHEWCADRFARDYYGRSPELDPPGPSEGTPRVIRGGDWYSDGRDCRSAFRYADIPDGRFYALGFRVVCDPTGNAAPDRLAKNVPAPAETLPSEPEAAAARSAAADPTSGEDWPRWRGPRGDGTWHAPKLPDVWPEAGVPHVWRQPLGGGYGGISATGGRVFVMDRQESPEDSERVVCFDATSGQELWSRQYPVNYEGVSYDNGPRSTPTVHGDRVYTLGAVGHLHCLDAADGRVVWSKDLVAEYSARVPIWGLSASPLVFEDMLIVHAGAEPDGCYQAFDLQTGELRWQSVPDAAGYATPLLVELAGEPHLIGWTPDHVRGLDPRSGQPLWSVPFVVNNGTAIANPIFQEGLVLVSSYYDGSRAIRPGSADSDDAEVAWQDRRNLRALMAQPLYRDGHAYLLDKRHGLTCFELATGEKRWDDDNRMTPKGRNPQATMVWTGDGNRVLVLNSDGELILAEFTPEKYQELARTKIIGPTWAHPAYAGNCVFARSDSEIVCVVLPVE